jgi:two-component system phosphate regulon response regulator PhoB
MLKGAPATSTIPIIMLTARGEEADIVVGLEMGADDYITKPFSPRVLLARVKAALRRKRGQEVTSGGLLQVEGLTIDPQRHEILVNGERVEMTASEFAILSYLARRPGWVFTRTQIIDGVKGDDYPVTDRSVDVQVVGIRRKLGPLADLIETVRGVGYRFKEQA